jgi:thymidine phosphorylase
MAGFLPQEVIRAKRDGNELAADEIAFLVRGITDGSVGDSQAAAFAMSVFFRGMTRAETVALTLAMRDSGRVLDWPGLPGPVVDKHSTGGVGDKVSLVLAPVLAACGAFVPMLSGRGLGHTGGTLDKLESIPGYTTQPDLERLRRTVRAAGCAIIGQTDDLAPADRRLYAIRDVTATVESVPLITASILAKKLAAGLQALVMDVKCGSGAFMPSLEQARALAESIIGVAHGAGLATTALVTDMGQCLGRSAGNSLEVAESIALLRGEPSHPRLRELVLHLSGEALALAGLAAGPEVGRAAATAALDSGAAAERFAVMARELGGPGDLLERHRHRLPSAPLARPVFPRGAGHVRAVDARALGLAVVELGGGRRHASHRVDHAVGLDEVRGVGDAVGPDSPLAVVHGRDDAAIGAAEKRLLDAYMIGETPPAPPATVLERIG